MKNKVRLLLVVSTFLSIQALSMEAPNPLDKDVGQEIQETAGDISNLAKTHDIEHRAESLNSVFDKAHMKIKITASAREAYSWILWESKGHHEFVQRMAFPYDKDEFNRLVGGNLGVFNVSLTSKGLDQFIDRCEEYFNNSGEINFKKKILQQVELEWSVIHKKLSENESCLKELGFRVYPSLVENRYTGRFINCKTDFYAALNQNYAKLVAEVKSGQNLEELKAATKRYKNLFSTYNFLFRTITE